MIREQEILNDIQVIKNKTELLANPLFNDSGGSHFWTNIDERLKQIKEDIEKDLKLFHII